MFPKSKRFNEPTLSEIPGPGAYNPIDQRELELAAKKGAMLDKTDRFREKQAQPDTFGLYDAGSKENRALQPRTATKPILARPSGEDIKLRLQVTALEKDLKRATDKLARLEQSRLDAAAEKQEHAKELSSLKTELRSTTAKLTTTSASLTKHQSMLPLLESQMTALSATNAASKAKRDAEITALRTERNVLSANLASTAASLTRAAHHADHFEEKFEMVSAAAERALNGMVPGERLVAVEDELHVARVRLAKLNRQLGDRAAQIEALASLAGQLEAELSLSAAQREDAERERDWALSELGWERDERAARRGEKDWRQRARSDQREIATVLDEARGWENEWNDERQAANMWSSHTANLQVDATATRVALEAELELAEGELELAVEEEIPRLEAELEEALEQVEDLSEEKERRIELDFALSELRTQTEEDADRWEGQLEQMKIQLAEKVKELDKEKAASRRVTSLLSQARASERALEEDLNAANDAIHMLQDDRTEASTLRRTLNQLAYRNQIVEEEAEQLAQTNTELVSHANPHQKIVQVAKMRAELSEAKRDKAQVVSALAALQLENDALKRQLEGLVSVAPSGHTLAASASVARSRVARPDMGDVLGSGRVSLALPQGVAFGARSVPGRGVASATEEGEDRRMSVSSMGVSVGGVRRAGRAVKEGSLEVVGEEGGARRKTGYLSVSQLF